MGKVMVESVLVVCTGNLCRSPIAERLLHQSCPDLIIDSAGTMGPVGYSADRLACYVSALRGISLDDHISRRLTPEMVKDYDLLLVMEPMHIGQIDVLSPGGRGKTMLFGHWSSRRDIPDPYRKSQDAFEYTFKLIEQATQLWAEYLKLN